MYQFNKTPRVWQHPTPQQTFPEVQSSKTAKQSGYLTDRLRSEPPDKDDSASTSQSETLDAGAAFFNRLAKSTHNPNAQLKMPTRQYTTPQASSSSSSPTDMPLLNKLRHEYSMLAAEVHGLTVSRLREVQSDLETAVLDSAKQDAEFLSLISGQENFTRSLNDENAQYDLMDEVTGRERAEVNRLGDSIKASMECLKALENEVHRLWDQWESTQDEISTILQEVAAQGSNTRHGHDTEDPEFSKLAATIRIDFKNDVKGFEKEWANIMREAMIKSKAAEQESKNSAALVIAGLIQRTILEL